MTQVAVRRWPGEAGPSLFLAHGTGFCKELWQPVVEELQRGGFPGPAVAWDFRGHGDSPVLEAPIDWSSFSDDVLSVVGEVKGVAGLGHSMGAAALLMAELVRPGTFASLVLVEPIIFPGLNQRTENFPVTLAALRRRPWFESVEDAFTSYSSKPVFSAWEDRALRAYVERGHRESDGGWTLKCLPETEAEVYRGATAHNVFERLAEVRARVLVLAGEHSETHPKSYVDAIVARLRAGEGEIVAGATHFLPMENPKLVAERVMAWLA